MNKHVKEYIEYYCRLNTSPEYALLLKGSWGCGKTYLVEETIEKLEREDYKFLLVSLYGISSIDDIETKFFQILNPVLSSKPIVLAGKLAKGLLKGTLRVDIDGDDKTDGNLKAGIPDINLNDYLTDTSNCILVFDDIERCHIELKQLLGYINYFVEKSGYKAILIADETKLVSKETEQDEKPNQYFQAKEKLIGKTLEVKSDAKVVYEHIVTDVIEDPELVEHFKSHQNHFIKIYNESGYDNLRSLRKALIESGRIWSLLDPEIKKKDELLLHLFTLLIVLSMEIFSGFIKPEEFNKLIGRAIVSRGLTPNADKRAPNNSRYSNIEKKYSISLLSTVLDIPTWTKLFETGHISKESLNSKLRTTSYFLQENTPNWMKLWRYWELEDADFKKALEDFKNEYDSHSFIIPGEINHAAGIMLKLSKLDLISVPVSDVVINHKKYIGDIAARGNIKVELRNKFDQLETDSHRSLQFHCYDTDEFKELKQYLDDKFDQATDKLLKTEAKRILTTLKTSTLQAAEDLNHSNDKYTPFARLPVLKHLQSKELTRCYLDLSNADKRNFISTLVRRYELLTSTPKLLEEKTVIKIFRKRLTTIYPDLENAPSKLQVEQAITQLEEVLDNFERLK